MTAYNFTSTTGRTKQWIPGETIKYTGVLSLSAALTTADTVTATDAVPKGATVQQVRVYGARLDTNANSTSQYKVGDATDDDRFISAGAGGGDAVTGMMTVINVAANSTTGVGAGYKYSADTSIVLTPTANAATGATSGQVFIDIDYYCGDTR